MAENEITTRAAELPEALRPIQRYKIGYAADDWGMRSSSPSGIPDTSGSWVRYADHVAQVSALSAARAGVPDFNRLRKALAARHFRGETDPQDLVNMAANVIAEDGQILVARQVIIEQLKAAAPQPSPSLTPAEAVRRIVHLRADREKRVYVAGPMTGLPEFNFPLFNATAERLRAEGWHVENPAEHGHVKGAGWADYLRWDISRIVTCGAIYLLPGWLKSKGARLEVLIAQVLGLRVLLADGAKRPQSSPAPADWEALRHSANEWADMASNGLQWVRNIADGISDAKTALANLEQNLKHCREVNDAPEVQAAIRAAASPAPTQPVQDLHAVNDAVTIDLLNERVAYLEAQLAKATAPAQPGQEGERDDWLHAFDLYARQFTYKNHRAEPRHFPKSAPWFEAGYRAARAAPQPATADAVDAQRWRWLGEHIAVAWDEGKFTSLVRIVSEKNRDALNAAIDRMMASNWSDADAAQRATHQGEQK